MSRNAFNYKMKKYFINRKIKWAYAAALLIIVVLVLVTYNNLSYVFNDSRKEKGIIEERIILESVLSHVRSLDSGLRSFNLYANENLLTPYYRGLGGIKRDTVRLNNMLDTKEEPERMLWTDLINRLREKSNHTIKDVESRRLKNYDSVSVSINEQLNLQYTDTLVMRISSLLMSNRETVKQASDKRKNFTQDISYQFFILAFLFLSVLGFLYFIMNRDFKRIFEADKQLKFNASLIRNISDPIITTDIFNKISNWNIYAEKLFGYKEEEVLGKEADELFGISPVNESLKEMRNPHSKKDFWKGELILHHKNGMALHTEGTFSAIKDENGNKTGTVSVIRDITERKKTEQILQRLTSNLENEVKIKATELTMVFERITDAFIALDNNWKYTYVNKKAAEMHHRPIEALIGRNIWEEYPDLIDEPFFDTLHLAKKTGEPQRAELYYTKTDKWFEDLIYPSPDGISVYYHDITEKKNAQLALQQTHEKLSYHINNTPLGVVEFNMSLQIEQWSKRAAEIFGWSKEDLQEQKSLVETLVFQDDIILVEQAIHNIVDKNYDNGVLQIRNNTKDGRVIYCEWYNSVLKDDKGNVTGVIAMVHDITHRKEIQIELEEAESKFRNLVEQSMVGVYIIQAGKFSYVNPRLCEITGYASEEMINKLSVMDVVHPHDRAMVGNNLEQRIQGELKSLNYQLRGLKKNGEDYYAEVFGSLTQSLGKPAIIGTLIDITERFKAIEKMQESEKALKISNERFLLVAKATKDAIWDWNIIDNKILGNEVFSKLFNIAAGTEISFETFLQKQHPQDKAAIAKDLQQAINHKQSLVTEQFRFILNEHETLTFNNRAYIIYDINGKAIRMLGAMQDITEQTRNEQQIILEKELSDSIINSLPGVFYLYNKKGDFYRWNNNFLKVSGYTSEELKNITLMDLFPDEEKERVRLKVKNVFKYGDDFVEANFVSKDGEKTPYYFTGRVIQYEGEPCLMGVGIDISERVKSQQELAQSEERYRTIIEQASDGIFISDLSGRYLDVNTNGVRLSGYSKEELLNRTIYDLMPPGDMDKNPLRFQEILTGNVAINERVLKRKDGSLREIEISAKLLADGRFLGIVRDITTRKKAQEAIRISEEKYRLLFNQNPMPMFMIELPERKFLDVNNAAIDFYGYSKEEFLQMNANDIRPDYASEQLINLDSGNETGVQYAGILDHKKKDGTIVRVNIIAHHILNEGKDAMLVLANDVTEKMKAEEELKKSHEELRQLATYMEKVRETERTHIAREIHDELGQQLTGLKMDISWLNRKLKNQEEEVQQKIIETIELIDTTVKTVRRIATELRPSILDDLGLLAAMEWQSEEFEKRFEIECIFNSNLADTKINPDLATGIFRIYQECLTNVVRHAAATRVISHLQIKDQSLMLSITDNGKGFIEMDIANKKTLGLLGMKERSNLMGGSYEILSQPGEGTSVIIVVPLKNK
jgi:PAS domain S-box-containing protein